MKNWIPSILLMLSNLQLMSAQPKDIPIVAYTDNERYQFSEGLCAIQRNQLWGFMDTTGKVVIDFKFRALGQETPLFKEGKCAIGMISETGDLKRMYIDKIGNSVFPNKNFSGITSFSGGMAMVEITEATKPPYLILIDHLGKPIIGAALPSYSAGMKLEFRGFHEGLAAICDASTKAWGYINNKGKWAISPEKKYRTVGDFHDGLAFVQESLEGKWGAINTKGELIIPFVHSNRPGDFSDGLSAIRNNEEKVGYMDKTGNLIIPYLYEPIYNQTGFPFFEGNAIVCRDNAYYSITTTGKENMKVGDTTSEIQMLQNGLIVIKKWMESEIWGIVLMRTNGEVIFKPSDIFQLGEFGNGIAYASAKRNGIIINGFVNLDSNFVILNENK